MLHAYIDDSGNNENQGPYFVLGAVIASLTAWDDFVVDWQHALDLDPPIACFKASEARRLRGSFDERKGWTPELRDQRLDKFLTAIESHVEYRIIGVASFENFSSTIRDVPYFGRHLSIDHPFVWLASRLTTEIAAYVAAEHPGDKCLITFDESQGFDRLFDGSWNTHRQIFIESGLGDVIPNKPQFASDDDILPLQAADLVAYYSRHRGTGNTDCNDVIDRLNNVRGDVVRFSAEEMVHNADQLSLKTAMAQTLNPGLKLTPYSKKGASRNRKRSRS